jgi:cytochrome c
MQHRAIFVCSMLALAAALVQWPASAAAQGATSERNATGVQPGSPGAADRASAERQRRGRTGNLVGHGGPVKAVAVDIATSRALTGSFDYAMMLWDVAGEQGQRLARFDEHNGAINAVAFVSGGKLALAAGDDAAIAVWDLGQRRLVARLEGHEAKIVGLAISPDGRWAASASWDRTARVWDLTELAAGPVLRGHAAQVNAVAFSSDGERIYSASADGTIGLWDRRDGSFQRPLYRNGWGLNVLARLPGSEQIAFGGLNGAVGIIDGQSGEVVRTLTSHERPILAIDALEKPGVIATGSADGVIRVWRSGDGSLIEEYRNPYGPIWALAFTQDGTALYYGGLDDFVTLWRIVPREPYERIESRFPRRFQVSGDTSSDIAAGEIQFARKCSVCHTVQSDGRNRAGPTLYKVFGRKIGSLEGYPYSEALKKLDIIWTPETIGKLFELGPEVFTPGSKMPLQKMADRAQREALIAYLVQATRPAQDAERAIDERGGAGQGLSDEGARK